MASVGFDWDWKSTTLEILFYINYKDDSITCHVVANRRHDTTITIDMRETRVKNAVDTIAEDVKVVLQLCRCEGDFHNNEIQEACSTQH